jgi:hypothetical protein
MLKHFHVDRSRVDKIVDVEFYQIDLRPVFELSQRLDPDVPVKLYPSWSKMVAEPYSSKGFFTRMLQSLFLGQHGIDSMNVDLQVRNLSKGKVDKTRVAMLFLPGSTKVHGEDAHLETLCDIARSSLPNFEVVEVSGRTTCNANAEELVKWKIKFAKQNGKNVSIMSAGMAQRSFSIPEINELYLAFDSGASAPVIQKMSRALTPSHPGKIGRIFSLSFCPQRDDKFDPLIIQSAVNLSAKNPDMTLSQALRQVLSTVDIFRCSPDESVKFTVDQYLRQLLDRNSFARYVGKTADFSLLTREDIVELSTGKSAEFSITGPASVPKGQIRDKMTGLRTNTSSNRSDADERKAREVVATLAENIDCLFAASGTNTVDDLLEKLGDDKELQDGLKEMFGITLKSLHTLFSRRVIDRRLIEVYKCQ